MKMKPNVKNVLNGEKMSFIRNTNHRMNETLCIIESKKLDESFYISNGRKITKDTKTTNSTNDALEYLADYILESENITTKKNEYNILDAKRMQDVEMNEQPLPAYSSDDEKSIEEAQLTNALINRERLLKYEDTVYQLLKEDYELINEGAMIEDLWCYQTLPNKDARRLVEDCFNLIQYYLMELNNTCSMNRIKATRRKVKELLFGDISSIIRSYIKHESYQKRSGIKANKKLLLEFSEETSTNRHHMIFKYLVTDKGTITNPAEIIPFVDMEQAIEKGIRNGVLNKKDLKIIELLKNHYHGDLVACLKSDGKYTTNRYRFKKLIEKLESIC